MSYAGNGVVGGGGPGMGPGGPPVPSRKSRPVWADIVAGVCYGLVLGSGIVGLLYGYGKFGNTPDPEWRTLGYGAMFLALTTAPIWLCVATLRRKPTETGLRAGMDRLAEEFRRVAEQASLSSDARRVINRRSERDLLCRAIEEDIAAQDWDAGLVLCDELADRFGYRAEAEEFRGRIENARAEIQDRRVSDSIAALNGLIMQRRWDAAVREAARITRLYRDSSRVDGLRDRVNRERLNYKADLERRFLEAAEQGRFDEAMNLLKELDGYLSEHEAEPYREVARGVIGKARDNLGAQFKIAVRDRQWASAAAIGRRIINEFPNTRMAQEVRGMLEGILARANSSTAQV